jgi:hypothetical protein
MAMSGEETQALGTEGVRKAKHYLEGTGRAEVLWDNPTAGLNKLKYDKANGGTYSFDCGGKLEGEGNEGRTFLAEVKHYHTLSDLARQFIDFLAKCYRTLDYRSTVADNFLWITWNPHASSRWPDLATAANVKEAVLKDQTTKDIALGDAEIKDDLCSAVASALIIVVLSDRQLELLSLTKRERLHMRQSLMALRAT